MKTRHNGMGHHQVNAMLLGQQTGSRVYAPLEVDWQPAPKLPAIVRVGLILAGSLIGWTVIVLFALAVRAVW